MTHSYPTRSSSDRTGREPQRLDGRTMPALAIGRFLVAVKLQQGQRHRVEYLAQLATTGVDEQADGGHERWQNPDDRPRLLHRYRARALGIKHQPDGIGPGLHRRQRVLDAGDPATLAEIGRAHVCTPVTNAPLVCRLLPE